MMEPRTVPVTFDFPRRRRYGTGTLLIRQPFLAALTTISTGQQTIPFLRIGDIAGTGEPLLNLTKTVTTVSGICGQDDGDTLTVDQGDAVKFCYQATNLGTWDLYDVQVDDDNATPSGAADDFTVPLTGLPDLDGQDLLYIFL